MDKIIAEDLGFTYLNYETGDTSGRQPVFEHLSFEIRPDSFTWIEGDNGSGKSTLLRLLHPLLRPRGVVTGLLTCGENILAYVPQDSEHAIVTDKVWHELVFAMENLNIPEQEMKSRSAEIAACLGLEDLLDKNTDALSGGQKQLVCIGAALALRPDILLLDEPFGQLDPVSCDRLMGLLMRLRSMRNLTIVMAEHREEYASKLCTDVIHLKRTEERKADINNVMSTIGNKPYTTSQSPIRAEKISFAYEKQGKDILRELNYDLTNGKIAALLGGNGCGKTTFLKCMAGICKPYEGKVRTLKDCRICYLPQDVQTMFLEDEVIREVRDEELLISCGLGHALKMSPYDLSGGEMQLLAMLKLICRGGDVFLLDEPARGLCGEEKERLAEILKALKNAGKAVLMVTHDTQFASMIADECMLMYRGEIVGRMETEGFMKEHLYFTSR